MNYIKLINWFWENVIEYEGYKSDYGILFFSITDSINRNDWRTTEIEYDRLINKTKMGKRMYLESRNWLQENNIILFEAGKNEFSKAKFSVSPEVQKSTTTALLKDPLQHHTGTATVTSTAPSIDKPLNKETKKQRNKETLPGATAPVRAKNEFYEVFQEWFISIAGVPYSMKVKDWVGVSEIKKYCEENCTNSAPVDSFKLVLAKFSLLPTFFQENRNPKFIGARFSEIVGLLKSPTTEKKSGQTNLVQMHIDAVSKSNSNDVSHANLSNLLGQ